jgi:hypothetical protein
MLLLANIWMDPINSDSFSYVCLLVSRLAPKYKALLVNWMLDLPKDVVSPTKKDKIISHLTKKVNESPNNSMKADESPNNSIELPNYSKDSLTDSNDSDDSMISEDSPSLSTPNLTTSLLSAPPSLSPYHSIPDHLNNSKYYPHCKFSMKRFSFLLYSLQQDITVRVISSYNLSTSHIVVLSLLYETNEIFIEYDDALPIYLSADQSASLSNTPKKSDQPHMPNNPNNVPNNTNLSLYLSTHQRLLQPMKKTEFYNDAINLYSGLKNDFMAYFESGGSSSSLSLFSLAKFSFLLDAANKALMLKIESTRLQRYHYMNSVLRSFDDNSGYFILKVHRNNLIQDTLKALASSNRYQFLRPLRVHFFGENGVDAGGLRKEFFQLIFNELFDLNYGLFIYDNETNYFNFNPNSLDSPLEFELIGTLMGIAIYNSTILDLHFPKFLYKKLLNYKVNLKDLLESQPAIGKGLLQLLVFEGDIESTYCWDFTYSYERYGEQHTVELIENGSNIRVTNDNKERFVELTVEYILEKSIERQFNAFYKGFYKACAGDAIRVS